MLSEGKIILKLSRFCPFFQIIQSQFIAFVGNVLLSFPIALGIIYGLEILFGQNLPLKIFHLLKDLDPFHSKVLFHAALRVYLFISGIIAGNVGNTSVFIKFRTELPKSLYPLPFRKKFC